ncbi:acyl-CoA ligase (AMP-forming), exosortase A system-associated [Uliginosibacterium aquaticum]|uniref:Acyl-CoA ligase (AMP-forming), exosortase A system-associated n=1 Tax=Uliginosibacterium aquaticum TaxID=2731212 RepID=A0ABX2IF45_9RHOO|nr:acyl-CoA ligase (AMP-forming), exosortase A system-associated [Uliginosibacterium aquaticum]NSL55289.1 acyl-CoA ligase (AMP-forming), exosortase A system-associated [Uliginosibacterium aquaticum]
MRDSWLLHHLIENSAARSPAAPALTAGSHTLDYASLWQATAAFASGLTALGLGRNERVAIWLDKRIETVVASFGTTAAGGVFVPVNPLLKPEQVAYILRDCNVRMLVTSPERLATLQDVLPHCADLRHVLLTAPASSQPPCAVHAWAEFLQTGGHFTPPATELDMAAILYTSGSTGRPKGVVLSHRNLVAGAKSVANYLGNRPDDSLLAALPLSFDAGFSQLTTAFHAGARVVLLNYLMPRDVIKTLAREKITGLTAVPPLWIQLAQQAWPESIASHLRYIANTGGHMPLATLQALQARLPQTTPYLMYGLTEAFRATYLDPEEVTRRPDSIGKAIPDNEVLVLRPNGTECAANEPGELVQRGPLVAMGYWNDAEKTAERFRPVPSALRPHGLMLPEMAVYSGDTVRRDEEGFLYFIGRTDEMIKTSGYRVSPAEVEEEAYATGLLAECAAVGVPHPQLGAAIVLIATPSHADLDSTALLAALKVRLPAYQLPAYIALRHEPLPRNANGKIDRKALATTFLDLFPNPPLDDPA